MMIGAWRRMTLRAVPAVLAVALLASWALAATGASARHSNGIPGLPPGIPTVPPTVTQPNPKTLPGSETVTFKLVVEGQVFALGSRMIDNEDLGVCNVQLSEVIDEKTEFNRGKGLLMEFVRYHERGKTLYAAQRAGRNGDSSFALVYSLKRTASGKATVRPAFPPAPCFMHNEDLSSNPSCDKEYTGTSNWGLRIKGSTFSIRPAKGTGRPISACGAAQQFGGLENLAYQWPVAAPLSFQPLPIAKLFGNTRQFKVTLREPHDDLKRTSGPLALHDVAGPGFAYVRFIRVPNP